MDGRVSPAAPCSFSVDGPSGAMAITASEAQTELSRKGPTSLAGSSLSRGPSPGDRQRQRRYRPGQRFPLPALPLLPRQSAPRDSTEKGVGLEFADTTSSGPQAPHGIKLQQLQGEGGQLPKAFIPTGRRSPSPRAHSHQPNPQTPL